MADLRQFGPTGRNNRVFSAAEGHIHGRRRADNIDIFLLEYDDWRSGSFEPLRDLPAGKVAVLGLISTKREEVEPAEEIITRIEEASRFYPREQLALSAQCGFAPQPDDNIISAASLEAKLRLVADIAHRVWR